MFMRMFPFRSHTIRWRPWVATLATVCSLPAFAAASPLAFDPDDLLLEPGLFQEDFEGPIWGMEARDERVLLMLPFQVAGGDESVMLDRPPVQVRGARFLNWFVEPPREDEPEREAPEESAAPQDLFEQLVLGERERAEQRPRRSTRPRGRRSRDRDDEQLDETPPGMARQITVETDGRVTWELDRFPNAEVVGEGVYALRLDRDRLDELEPDRPPRGRSDRRADQQYRYEMTEYRELQQRVRQLEATFESQPHARVWAIFEMPVTARQRLAFEGEHPDLPWQISLSDLQMLREIAGIGSRFAMDAGGMDADPTMMGGGRNQEWERREREEALLALAREDHQLTQRLLARAVARSNPGRAESDDTTYVLLEHLLTQGGDEAQKILAHALARSQRSDAVNELLQRSAGSISPPARLLALKGLVHEQPDAEPLLELALGTAGELLNDDAGPAPAAVVEALLQAIDPDEESAIATAAEGLSFQNLSDQRLRAAAGRIAQRAGHHPLAAAWLDQQLLDAGDERLVRAALTALAEHGETVQLAELAQQREQARARAERDTDERDMEMMEMEMMEMDMMDGMGRRQADGEPVRVHLVNAAHGYFNALDHDSSEIRELAWEALAGLTAGGQRPRSRRGSDRPESDPDAVYDALIDAAGDRETTPQELAAFLAAEPAGDASLAAMARLIGRGGGEAMQPLAEAIMDHAGRQLANAVRDMDAGDRERFAAGLYETLQGDVPRVVALLRSEDQRGRSPAVEWFVSYLQESELPEPAAWAHPFEQGRDSLMDLAEHEDERIAEAAIAAMVYAAGGDASWVDRAIDRLAGESGITLTEQWDTTQREIYLDRLREASGDYRLQVQLRGEAEPDDDELSEEQRREREMQREMEMDMMMMEDDMLARREPIQLDDRPVTDTFTLGMVELTADSDGLRFSNDIVPLDVAEGYLAIRIEPVNELLNFDHEAMDELDLGSVRDPLDLVPQEDGDWVGQVQLLDGRAFELRLEPR